MKVRRGKRIKLPLIPEFRSQERKRETEKNVQNILLIQIKDRPEFRVMKPMLNDEEKRNVLTLSKQYSGGDALRGHTRSHPEHDG